MKGVERGVIPRKRPKVTRGITERVSTGCGYIYVTLNFDEHGVVEVFSTLGKAGGCAGAQLEAISRLISLSLRSGLDLSSVVKQLRGIRCPSIAWEQGHAITSCADAIASVLQKYIKGDGGNGSDAQSSEVIADTETSQSGNSEVVRSAAGQCPECGGPLIYQEGCNICLNCGFTKCG